MPSEKPNFTLAIFLIIRNTIAYKANLFLDRLIVYNKMNYKILQASILGNWNFYFNFFFKNSFDAK